MAGGGGGTENTVFTVNKGYNFWNSVSKAIPSQTLQNELARPSQISFAGKITNNEQF